MLLVEVLENPNKYYGQLSVGPRFLDGSMWPLQKAVTLSAADVALDSDAVLHSCFVGQQEGAGRTRLKTLKEEQPRGRNRCGTLTQGPGAISRSAQYIC